MEERKKKKKKKVCKLPSGNVRRRVYIGRDASGKRMYKSFTAESKDALDIAVGAWKAAGGVEAEQAEKDPALSVAEAVRRYIDLKSGVLSPATVKGYEADAKNYITHDSIGLRDVNELTTRDAQLWISTLSEKLSPKTVKNAYGLFISSVRLFRPGWDPKVTMPQRRPPELYCPSDADVKALLAAAKDPELEIAILLAAFGPMRRSEICALTSADIHGNTITINKALVQNKDKDWELKGTKTVSSNRSIEMPPFVIDRLKGIKGRIIKSTPSGLSDKFQRAIREADCPRFRFHDLRHYGASIMHAIGVPDKYIMARGGWASDGVMKRVYQNVIQEEQAKQTAVINDHFSSMMSG